MRDFARGMLSTAKTSFGPFYVQHELAQSERAELSLATFFSPDGHRPLTVLRRIKATSPAVTERFIEHASRYAVLRHPNIAEVKDLGALDGRSYVATEWIEGRSLLSALAACGRLGVGFPTDIALYIAIKVLDALEAAHSASARRGGPLRILHCDIRHSNVILRRNGIVKVTDFEMGLASTHAQTERGVCIGGRQGYFAYLSPEQARGDPLDARSDLFALGVVLYELVTGRHLFSDKSEDWLLARIAQGQYDLPITRYRPDLHPELESILRTALAHDPDDRFSSARVFREALGSFLASVGVGPGPEELAELMEQLFGTDEDPE